MADIEKGPMSPMAKLSGDQVPQEPAQLRSRGKRKNAKKTWKETMEAVLNSKSFNVDNGLYHLRVVRGRPCPAVEDASMILARKTKHNEADRGEDLDQLQQQDATNRTPTFSCRDTH